MQQVNLPTTNANWSRVCAISVVRLWDLIEEDKRPDFTYDNVSIAYLTCIEVNAAIACACCMTLKPLVARIFPRLWGSRSDLGAWGGERKYHDLEALAQAEFSDSKSGNSKRGPAAIRTKPSRGIPMSPGMIGRSLWKLSTRSDTWTCASHLSKQEDENDLDGCTTRGCKDVDRAGGIDSPNQCSEGKESGWSLLHQEGMSPVPEPPGAVKLRGE